MSPHARLTAAILVAGVGVECADHPGDVPRPLHGTLPAPGGPDGGLGAGRADAGPSRGGAAPNIVFILTDDLSWNLVAMMPAVQALQRDGMTFSHYFVTDSLCCPSRSSIFTGKYPHDTHVFTNTPPGGGYAVFQKFGNATETFAVALERAHYRTGMMGKYLNGYEPTEDGADPGWATWDVAGDGYNEFDYALDQDGRVESYGAAPEDYLTDVLSGLATRFVRDGGPFMLEVATFAPHAPYVPAPRYAGKFHEKAPRVPSFGRANSNPPRWLEEWPPLTELEIAQIDRDFNLRVEAVQAVDDLVRSMRETLRASGQDKNTYIFFSSDNGYHMGEHMLLPGKQTAFDSDIRVPLVVVGPGIASGVVDDHMVENIDLCPTFADLAGAPPPTTAEGRSLVSLLAGESVDVWRSAVLVEHKGPDVVPVDPGDPDREMSASAPNSYEALRMPDAVFVRYRDGETEYYDDAVDPWEMTNTAASLPPEKRSAYEQRIARIQACHSADECWAAQR
jgi:arylsulfatase A-like enzyme